MTTTTRTNTPDVITVDDDGRNTTTIKLKRACNGCGQHLGDITDQEMARGINGLPLPDDGQPDHCHAAVLLELANQPAPA